MDAIVTDRDLERLKYPKGMFVRGTKAATAERIAECIDVIEGFPDKLRAEMQGLSDAQLDTPYRPGGWTVRQLVHHIADSHSQTLHRFKLALTEEKPVIKPYKEALWSEHVDARTMPLDPSLDIIAGTHARWVVVMRAMKPQEWDRVFVHPEQQREIALCEAVELYVWHSKHHLAHITELKRREGW
ncbi:MAG: putative metal-dependent hydrolase [Flavobacteriales bacterium]|nr:putative metal-dependent hydrolase [Flavobacteriales bacterium]